MILNLSANLKRTPIRFDQAAHIMGEHLSPSPNKMDPSHLKNSGLPNMAMASYVFLQLRLCLLPTEIEGKVK